VTTWIYYVNAKPAGRTSQLVSRAVLTVAVAKLIRDIPGKLSKHAQNVIKLHTTKVTHVIGHYVDHAGFGFVGFAVSMLKAMPETTAVTQTTTSGGQRILFLKTKAIADNYMEALNKGWDG